MVRKYYPGLNLLYIYRSYPQKKRKKRRATVKNQTVVIDQRIRLLDAELLIAINAPV